METLCKTCLGCNRLELDSFNEAYRCENYVKGVNEDEEKSIKRIFKN
jgi:hypothetical protein